MSIFYEKNLSNFAAPVSKLHNLYAIIRSIITPFFLHSIEKSFRLTSCSNTRATDFIEASWNDAEQKPVFILSWCKIFWGPLHTVELVEFRFRIIILLQLFLIGIVLFFLLKVRKSQKPFSWYNSAKKQTETFPTLEM